VGAPSVADPTSGIREAMVCRHRATGRSRRPEGSRDLPQFTGRRWLAIAAGTQPDTAVTSDLVSRVAGNLPGRRADLRAELELRETARSPPARRRACRMLQRAAMKSALLPVLAVLAGAAGSPGCASDDPDSLDEEWGMDGPLTPTPPIGKDDSELRRGLLVATDTTRTQVWTARNRWEDVATPAARAAGLAWPADSGLDWDAKYSRWVASLPWIPALDGHATTVALTTPWGKTLPSPMLECAEASLFLRITFAAWHGLPLMLEAQDSRGQRVYFGHNGVRTQAGRYARSPEFAVSYRDHTGSSDGRTSWPSDPVLRAKRIAGGEDDQPEIGPGAHFGAYLDELHLNKRVGYFTVMVLDYLGSANLADPANAYNLAPEAVRPGDTLVERWQRVGIGHTLVVKQVEPRAGGSKEVTLISGSMPRRQSVRQTGQTAKSYFTSVKAGGPGTNSDGDAYARLGGGLKRWRVAKNIGGYWTNTWMAADESSWINSTDLARIAARPERFGQILGEVPPAQQRTELLAQIADARRHLSQYPASCSARERREQAFAALYELSERAFGRDPEEVDAAHRVLDDYVFAELDYAHARTCCWNSSTSAMYDIIMQAARTEAAIGVISGRCTAPVVFKSREDGYLHWENRAGMLGRAAEWRAWSEDESCPQRAVAVDEEAGQTATPYCQLD
jgi:hypothetical protein